MTMCDAAALNLFLVLVIIWNIIYLYPFQYPVKLQYENFHFDDVPCHLLNKSMNYLDFLALIWRGGGALKETTL
jgi:hypothetical protein